MFVCSCIAPATQRCIKNFHCWKRSRWCIAIKTSILAEIRIKRGRGSKVASYALQVLWQSVIGSRYGTRRHILPSRPPWGEISDMLLGETCYRSIRYIVGTLGHYHLLSLGGPLSVRLSNAVCDVRARNDTFNPLMGTSNYSATSNNMKLIHWPLMVGCYIWYSDEGTGRGRSPPRPLIAVPNVTARPSTASVPIIVLVRCSAVLMCPLKG